MENAEANAEKHDFYSASKKHPEEGTTFIRMLF